MTAGKEGQVGDAERKLDIHREAERQGGEERDDGEAPGADRIVAQPRRRVGDPWRFPNSPAANGEFARFRHQSATGAQARMLERRERPLRAARHFLTAAHDRARRRGVPPRHPHHRFWQPGDAAHRAARARGGRLLRDRALRQGIGGVRCDASARRHPLRRPRLRAGGRQPARAAGGLRGREFRCSASATGR